MFLDAITRINFHKWHSQFRIVISKDFEFEVIALIDSGADLNCIQEGIIPSKYFKKSRERLTSESGEKMQIEFKIPKAHICQDNMCFKTTFVLVKNLADKVILGNPFWYQSQVWPGQSVVSYQFIIITSWSALPP